MRLLERLRENCGGLGERPAFCSGGEAMSWAVLGAKVRATAAMLAVKRLFALILWAITVPGGRFPAFWTFWSVTNCRPPFLYRLG